MRFDLVRVGLTAMSRNLQKGLEGKIKEGVWRFGFFVSCPWVSGVRSGPGRLAVSCSSGMAYAARPEASNADP